MTTTTTQSIWFLDALARIHVDSRHTDGRFGLVEMRLPRGHQPPPHIHDNEDECFYVLEGAITIFTPNQEIALGPGQAYNAPRGVCHTFSVTSAEARLLTIGAPAGFEAFVRAFGTAADRDELPVLDGPPDVEELARVAADHGIRLVGPPGALPAEVA